MLERIREGSQGPWAMIIIGLVVLSFVFAGVGSYLNSSGQTVAATVNGEEISLNELERAYQAQRGRMEAQYGESISAMFSDEAYLKQFRQGVLDNLINEALVEQKARELGLRISDNQIRETILNMQEFQLSGQFNNERYLSILRQNGFQPSDFREYLRVQLTREQLARSLGVSDFALPGEAKAVFALQAQTRNARYAVVKSAQFADDIVVSDTDIQGYYDANISDFDTEEKVAVSYVTLTVDDLTADVKVTPEDIAQWYEENKDQFITEEQRRVSHILIESGEDDAAAKTKAEALLSELRSGADFAELAEENSDDTFSAENGGDLDYIAPGMMDDAFERAAFALSSVGELSEVIQSEYGYHIIKLTDLQPEKVQSLAEVTDEIRENLVADKATERFYEIQSRMAEVAFEVPDTLDEVAAIAEQPVETTALFSRGNVPSEIDFPQVVSSVFSVELIEEGVNSDLIELDGETVIVVRVSEHEPQRTKALDEVKDDITVSLRAEKAQQAAQSWAEEQLALLNQGESIDDQLASRDVSWETAENVNRADAQLPRGIVDTLFTLAPSGDRSKQVVTLLNGDVALVELTGVNAAEEANETAIDAIAERLAAMNSQMSYQAYVEGLREGADIEIKTVR